MYKKFFKRKIDFFISLVLFVILSLPMLVLAILIKLDSEGPAIFRQERLGLDGKPFYIYKFRTMQVGAETTGTGVYSEKGDPRVTRVGRVLRATSLDEIPQLINILKGEMSFVGPRPPLTYHPWTIDEYTNEQSRMFEMRPGITGWAQVHGRKTVEWNQRIKYSVWYVDHVSLFLDIKILLLTFMKVLSNKDNVNHGSTIIEYKDISD